MRRQNSSCDQCRKGKRACDAGAVKDIRLCLDRESQWDINWQDLSGPCSNCLKTSKRCTFDWVRSQQLHIRERRQSSASEKRPPPNRKRVKSAHSAATPSSVVVGESETFQNFLQLLDPNQANPFHHEHSDLQTMLSDPLFHSNTESFLMSPTNDTVSTDSFADDLSLLLPASSSTSWPSGLSDELPGLDETEVISAHDPSLAEYTPKSFTKPTSKARKRSWKGRHEANLQPGGISTSSPTQQIISRTNSGLMTDNLMKLYHDVMEGALSCWLTEQNCPYLRPPKSENLEFSTRDLPAASMQNRIYHRVLKLDKSLDSLGMKPLTTSEDRKATRALHFSIMAFTAQWAQGSRRSQARCSPTRLDDESSLAGFEEFDATLQLSFWNQARRHLDDCSEIKSFKVAFAELVFGLTQKYTTDTEDSLSDFDADSMGYSGSLAEKIQEALARDEHNAYVERGARRLHVLKRRVECFDRKGLPNHKGQALISWKDSRNSAKSEERRTLELVFWLAVMFDTLTAAMIERPLAVSDEDSKDLTGKDIEDGGGASKLLNTTSEWNDRFIIKPHQRLAPLRWPCPEEAIAGALRDAAPVKVLLFRKITRLQTLSARGAGEQAIETVIQDALSVCRHWNMTYGPLFQDCIQNHDLLPPNVQSWYVCLLGHWLLAVMILADAIHLMDEQELGIKCRADERAGTSIIVHLRKSSSRLVSELAMVSTPRDDDTGKLHNYHHAANEGALLTEPWTMVLIRSFTMAGLSLLDEATEAGRETESGSYPGDELLNRCENCVKALWYLGRKSSVSMEVARILGDGLGRAKLAGHSAEEACVGLDTTVFGRVKVF